MTNTTQRNGALNKRRDKIVRLLEDLFILQAAKTGMKKEELRKLMAIDKTRINRISKHIRD